MSTYPATAALPQSASIVSRWLLDEASGTRADIVASNTLADNNTVLAGTGLSLPGAEYDNSADFEAANTESLSIADASQTGLDYSTAFSLAFFIVPETLPTAGNLQYLIAKWNNTGDQRAYALYVVHDGGVLNVRCDISSDGTAGNSDTSTAGDSISLANGTLSHLIFTYDAGSTALYLDGAQHGTDSVTPTSIHNSSAAFGLGKRDDSTATYDGLMQDAIAWSVGLTEAEAGESYALYQAGILGSPIFFQH